MQHLFEIFDKIISFLANLLTVLLGIKSVWEIIKFVKNKSNKKKASKSYMNVENNTSSAQPTYLNQNINNNYFGYFSYNFKNSDTLTELEIKNYNYDSNNIWKWIYRPSVTIVILYLIYYWLNAKIPVNWFSLVDIFNNIGLLMGSITSSLAQAFQQTFNLTWLAQFVVSILVIVKMVSASNILYRKTNIALYSLSLFFTWHLNNIFSTLSFKDAGIFNFISNTPTNISLESMKPLFNFYSVIILFFQLMYTIYVLYSGIRILKIGELKYLNKEIQSKKIHRGKLFILISPIILYVLWYFFKLYIA